MKLNMFEEILKQHNIEEEHLLKSNMLTCFRSEFEFSNQLESEIKNYINNLSFNDIINPYTPVTRIIDEFAIKKHNKFIPTYFHKHSFIELIYVYEGKCRQYIENEENVVVIHKNEICILNQNVTHAIGKCGDEDIILKFFIPVDFFDIVFLKQFSSKNILSDFLSYSILPSAGDYYNYIIFKTSYYTKVRDIITKILVEYFEKGDSYITVIKSYLIILFIELMRNEKVHINVSSNLKRTDYNINSVLKYIHMNFDSVTLERVANKFHFNADYLSRLIREKTQYSFSEIIQCQKLEHAAHLLKHSQMTIHDISERIGYKKPNYFYKVFKEKFGVTPNEYRNQLKRQFE